MKPMAPAWRAYQGQRKPAAVKPYYGRENHNVLYNDLNLTRKKYHATAGVHAVVPFRRNRVLERNQNHGVAINPIFRHSVGFRFLL